MKSSHRTCDSDLLWFIYGNQMRNSLNEVITQDMRFPVQPKEDQTAAARLKQIDAAPEPKADDLPKLKEQSTVITSITSITGQLPAPGEVVVIVQQAFKG